MVVFVLSADVDANLAVRPTVMDEKTGGGGCVDLGGRTDFEALT
jgi:hypothetical protein